MDSFESEFGIPPTKMVEAMALLEPQELSESPEDTASLVVGNLELSDEDKDRAQAMYAGLLAELQKIDVREQGKEFVARDGAATAPFMNQRLETNQIRRDAMNRSVDVLNQNFWKIQQQVKPVAPAPVGPMAAESFSADQWSMDEASLAAERLMERPVETATQAGTSLLSPEEQARLNEMAKAVDQAPTPENVEKLMNEIRALAEKRAGQGESVRTEAALPLAAQAQAPDSGMKLAQTAKVSAEAPALSAPALPMAAPSAPSDFSSDSGSGEEKSFSESDKESAKIQKPSAQPMPLKMEDVAAELRKSAPVAAPAAAAAMTLSPADNEANVRQLMNQAQYLIKRGGGEVKVEMTPEGMGRVQMKVQLQDGKVSVQMAAETSEAKKAIESSLSELRSSLAAHKLSMDHVKVDVVSGPNTENQARNDMNMNQQQGRDTRQFWNNFQEQFGNRGARDGLFDLPDLKGYRRFKDPKPLEPLDGVKSASRAVEGKGRGINLVA